MVEFRFEKLEAWQFAIDFCGTVYDVTKVLPSDERFGLISQLRRAVASIPANIAEGSGKSSDKEKIRFVEIAYGSLMEVVSHIEVAKRQNWTNDKNYRLIREQADRLARILSGYRKHLRERR